MLEYYKLSLLKKGSLLSNLGEPAWEDIYLEINGNESKMIATHPSVLTGVLGQKLERLSEEDTKKFFEDLQRDTGNVNRH